MDIEPENASLTSPAVAANDATASGGRYTRFGTPGVATTPDKMLDAATPLTKGDTVNMTSKKTGPLLLADAWHSLTAVVHGTLNHVLAVARQNVNSWTAPAAEASVPSDAGATTPCVASAAPAQWKHVVVVIMENHTYAGGVTPGVIGTKDGSGNYKAPYITGLAAKCASYQNWHDADYLVNGSTRDGTYISKPNYATLTNGLPPSGHGLLDDSNSSRTSVDNIYNQLRLAGKSGKDYFDASSFNSTTRTFTDNPTATGCSANFNGVYHDAIRYYTNIDSAYCNAHDVNISTFMTDVNGTLPDFSLVLPQNCHNMHSCAPFTADEQITNGDSWLAGFFPALLNSARYKSGDTAVFVLFDEDTPIPNLLIAPSITAGSFATLPPGTTVPFSHFSALRTWEEMLGLPMLGNSGQAPSLLSFYNGNCGSSCPPPPDTTPPTVSLTAPVNGATLTGTTNVTATASDNVGVTKVEFLIDGTLMSTDTSSIYSYGLDTTALSNSSHTIQAKAYDAAGNVTSTNLISVTVTNGCPVVAAPNGQVTFTANVSSAGTYHIWSRVMAPDSTANSYTFQTDGACNITIGDTVTTAGTWVWVDYRDGNPTTKANVTLATGAHTIVMAGREAGVKLDRVLLLSDSCVPTGTGSNCITTPDTTAPSVTITAPLAGSTVTSPISVSATASDTGGSGVSKVDFLVDGTLQATIGAPGPYNWTLTTPLTGSHTISAKAADAAGNVSPTANSAVTVADSTPPTVSVTAPTTNATISGLSVPVTATASDNVGVTKVEFYVDSVLKGTDISSPYSYSLDSTSLTNASHSISAKAYDAAGKIGTSSTVTVTVSNDKTAPTAPSNLTATATSSTSVSLAWTASTDNVGISKYQISRGGVIIKEQAATGVATAYADTTVASSTAYAYIVYAVDGAGNTSPASNTANVTTPATPDTIKPSVPANLTATLLSLSQVNLSWNPSTDAGGSGLAGYRVYRDGSLLTTTAASTTTYGDTLVTVGTTYSYSVSAIDGANNESAKSTAASITIPSNTATPGDINGDGKVNIFDLSNLLTHWNTADAASDVNHDGAVNVFDLSFLLSHWTG